MKKYVFLLILLPLLLVGCGKKDSRVTIKMTAWGNDVEEASIRDHLARFEEKYPNIHVVLEITPWARMLDKLMISTAGGRPPDVTRMSSEWFVPLASKGVLMPLDDYIARDNFDLGDFYDSALNGWARYNGHVYTLPTDIDIYAMYYNKKLFDECGVPYPDETWDYDKYVRECKKICADTNGDGKIDRWGGSVDQFYENYVYSFGGSTLSSDNRRCLINSDKAVKGLQFMVDLVHKYKVAPSNEDSANMLNNKLFIQGKIATYAGGSWAGDIWFDKEIKDFEWDVAPLPKGPERRASMLAGAAYAALSRSRHPDEAWLLVEWMTNADFQSQAAHRTQIIPARKSVADEYLKIDRPPRNKQVFLDAIADSWTSPKVSCAPEIKKILDSSAEKMRLGKEPVKKIADETVPVVDRFLQAEKKP